MMTQATADGRMLGLGPDGLRQVRLGTILAMSRTIGRQATEIRIFRHKRKIRRGFGRPELALRQPAEPAKSGGFLDWARARPQ
jgi:hypothetical protein